MTYNVYRIAGCDKPYMDFVATFEFMNVASVFCESEACQQASAIRDKSIGCSFVCIDQKDGNVEFTKYFKWDGI